MLLYTVGFEKTETRVKDPVSKKWKYVMVPQYTGAQLAELGEAVEALLGEDLISWEVEDMPGQQMTRVTYEGTMVEEVEEPRTAEIDAVYQAWYEATLQGGG